MPDTPQLNIVKPNLPEAEIWKLKDDDDKNFGETIADVKEKRDSIAKKMTITQMAIEEFKLFFRTANVAMKDNIEISIKAPREKERNDARSNIKTLRAAMNKAGADLAALSKEKIKIAGVQSRINNIIKDMSVKTKEDKEDELGALKILLEQRLNDPKTQSHKNVIFVKKVLDRNEEKGKTIGTATIDTLNNLLSREAIKPTAAELKRSFTRGEIEKRLNSAKSGADKFRVGFKIIDGSVIPITSDEAISALADEFKLSKDIVYDVFRNSGNVIASTTGSGIKTEAERGKVLSKLAKIKSEIDKLENSKNITNKNYQEEIAAEIAYSEKKKLNPLITRQRLNTIRNRFTKEAEDLIAKEKRKKIRDERFGSVKKKKKKPRLPSYISPEGRIDRPVDTKRVSPDIVEKKPVRKKSKTPQNKKTVSANALLRNAYLGLNARHGIPINEAKATAEEALAELERNGVDPITSTMIIARSNNLINKKFEKLEKRNEEERKESVATARKEAQEKIDKINHNNVLENAKAISDEFMQISPKVKEVVTNNGYNLPKAEHTEMMKKVNEGKISAENLLKSIATITDRATKLRETIEKSFPKGTKEYETIMESMKESIASGAAALNEAIKKRDEISSAVNKEEIMPGDEIVQ